MKVYINDYSVCCSLGINNDQVKSNLKDNSYIINSRPKKLTNGLTTPFLIVDKIFEPLEVEFKDYDSRNNRMLLHTFKNIESTLNNLLKTNPQSKIGIVLGTSTSGIDEGIEALRESNAEVLSSEYNYNLQLMSSPSDFLSKYLNLNYLNYTISTACTSSSRSIIDAKKLIESNVCDIVIAGGCDTYNQLTINGFNSLGAISNTNTNPFSKNRDGINIGEGAALFILSSVKSDLAVLGVGESSDAHHISSPDPAGEGAYKAMNDALTEANINSNHIDYINLHGTGTIKNDEMEAQVVSRLFKDKPLVSSTKPMTGHCLGATGAIELALCALAIESSGSFLPIHNWDNEADDHSKELNFVNSNSKCIIENSMSNSYAFGGNNTSIIIGKTNE